MALTPLRPLLKDRRVVLASASPRRREILGLTVSVRSRGGGRREGTVTYGSYPQGLTFDVIPSRFEESRRSAACPCASAYALDTATGKALEVANRMCQVGRGDVPVSFPG